MLQRKNSMFQRIQPGRQAFQYLGKIVHLFHPISVRRSRSLDLVA
jgi:hypothetical protein